VATSDRDGEDYCLPITHTHAHTQSIIATMIYQMSLAYMETNLRKSVLVLRGFYCVQFYLFINQTLL